jgi:hypothetical protein
MRPFVNRGLYEHRHTTDNSVRDGPTISKRRLNCSIERISINESLFNFGSEERISNDKESILKRQSILEGLKGQSNFKLSRFLHFAIEGHNPSHSRSFKVVALASINDYPNLGHL